MNWRENVHENFFRDGKTKVMLQVCSLSTSTRELEDIFNLLERSESADNNFAVLFVWYLHGDPAIHTLWTDFTAMAHVQAENGDAFLIQTHEIFTDQPPPFKVYCAASSRFRRQYAKAARTSIFFSDDTPEDAIDPVRKRHLSCLAAVLRRVSYRCFLSEA